MSTQLQIASPIGALESSTWLRVGRWGLAAITIAAAAAALGYQMSTRLALVREVPSSGNEGGVTSPGGLARAPMVAIPPSPVVHPADAAKSGDGNGLTWPIWEFRLQDPLPAREQPLTPVAWRVLGAALFDGRWHAIVQRNGAQAPEYYKAGDKLPGGYVIQAITQEDMTLRAGRREIVLAYIGSR